MDEGEGKEERISFRSYKMEDKILWLYFNLFRNIVSSSLSLMLVIVYFRIFSVF